MMVTATKIEVLDPTVEPIPAETVAAPRPDSLDGLVLGLLANGKPNAPEMLHFVHEVLADRYDFKSIVFRNKGNASRPCPTPIMDELQEDCDVVITSSGD